MQVTSLSTSLYPHWQRLSQHAWSAAALLVFACGFILGNVYLMAIAGVALCAIWRQVGVVAARNVHRLVTSHGALLPSEQRADYRRTSLRGGGLPPEEDPSESPVESVSEHRARKSGGKEKTTGDLVNRMIDQGRYALLLRHETASQLSDEELAVVLSEMDQQMSVIPEGRVLVGEYAERATWGTSPVSADCPGLVHTEGCYLDRYCVTNEQFQYFVDDCGYEQFQLWPEEALPALFEFVDRTGVPAPAGWTSGQFPDGWERLPVVGISWYEATAYARWVGKRLPTDAEWTKAGAWPVETSPGRVTQRRYPWGDTFEARRALLWSAGARGPQPVDAFEAGSSLGGVVQLIGNVWEWTSSSLDATSRDQATGDGHSMNVLHGGAFNTYFENQATCHFRSGERPLARRSNIGFRLALSFDVVADQEFGDGGASSVDDPSATDSSIDS
ncbi:formylglycine-generating enzyme family protein [Aeoliella mucimassa]|uniref:Serine/threonine-protein kinase pkn1 n=1 Tax=Aeoliella mucimassa TaxID=2527972 RepID=A0A518AVL3_9BACT|nr:SUMF1/EgtB/PvdO family nonheme iron enzyme [Aeoliella mucimassa]QDU58777.1 Serine/threonine-protein kinase pkn1 [Aeoliella mucimassa]